MDCKEVRDLISGYIENELSRELKREVSLHLEQCPDCRQLKEKVEGLLSMSPELEEEVPFFLKNRLYNIPETAEEKSGRLVYLKWLAAMVGTIVLFLNLFYFTNIFPPANRALHRMVSHIETFAVETSAFIERIKGSKGNVFSSFLPGDSDGETADRDGNIKTVGGKNG
jgi:predicted anti-sigma-YlaC factor YlaD